MLNVFKYDTEITQESYDHSVFVSAAGNLSDQ